MKIHKIGHSCFIFNNKDTKILIDPGQFSSENLERERRVTPSHDGLLRELGPFQSLSTKMLGEVRIKFIPLRPGEEYEIQTSYLTLASYKPLL